MLNTYMAHYYRMSDGSALPEKKSRKMAPIVEQVVEWLTQPDCLTIKITYPPTQECQKVDFWSNGAMTIFEKEGWIRINHLCHPSTPYDDRIVGEDYRAQLRDRDLYTHRIYERVKELLDTERAHICSLFDMHDEEECMLARKNGMLPMSWAP